MAAATDPNEVYDRQIRLWGVAAQQRMAISHVMFVGISGVAAETCKNIVLAGVGSVTLVDDGIVAADEIAGNVLLRPSSVGKSRASECALRAREFNPMVAVHVRESPPDASVALDGVTCVVASIHSAPVAVALNAACRAREVLFFATQASGLAAFYFTDVLDNFEFVVTKKRKESDAVSAPAVSAPATGKARYGSLAEALAVPWTHPYMSAGTQTLFAILGVLRAQLCGGDTDLALAGTGDASRASRALVDACAATFGKTIAPVASVVGGFLCQDVLRALTHRDAPARNFFVFDAAESSGLVFQLFADEVSTEEAPRGKRRLAAVLE